MEKEINPDQPSPGWRCPECKGWVAAEADGYRCVEHSGIWIGCGWKCDYDDEPEYDEASDPYSQEKRPLMREQIEVWVSKWALTEGIEKMKAIDIGGGVAECSRDPIVWRPFFLSGEGTYWHRTHEEAVKRADQMRKAKIASLKRQIAKLEAMTFGGGQS